MKTRTSRTSRGAGQAPLDHLRPGGHQPGDADDAPPSDNVGPNAEPAEPLTPGGGDADALRGKATRSPAEVATRPHLEGSEQGPV